jgi:hypothetical protein
MLDGAENLLEHEMWTNFMSKLLYLTEFWEAILYLALYKLHGHSSTIFHFFPLERKKY